MGKKKSNVVPPKFLCEDGTYIYIYRVTEELENHDPICAKLDYLDACKYITSQIPEDDLQKDLRFSLVCGIIHFNKKGLSAWISNGTFLDKIYGKGHFKDEFIKMHGDDGFDFDNLNFIYQVLPKVLSEAGRWRNFDFLKIIKVNDNEKISSWWLKELLNTHNTFHIWNDESLLESLSDKQDKNGAINYKDFMINEYSISFTEEISMDQKGPFKSEKKIKNECDWLFNSIVKGLKNYEVFNDNKIKQTNQWINCFLSSLFDYYYSYDSTAEDD